MKTVNLALFQRCTLAEMENMVYFKKYMYGVRVTNDNIEFVSAGLMMKAKTTSLKCNLNSSNVIARLP